MIAFPVGATAQSLEDLQHLSIEDLANIEISSVSKKAEPLSDAAAAVYVVTHDDIVRSGATSIPEMLRLAPNLQVAQFNAATYAISARGFNGTLANKLLVLIDGRSVYTPLYGGVYWDMQDVMRDDVERIEVISGPGATLWGANAVNGVINIITRKSGDTQGGSLEIGAGNLERSASAQFGGRLSDDMTYRVYAKAFENSALVTSSGKNAHDRWSMPQGGFRVDWNPADESITFQGDVYRGTENQVAAANQTISGGNLLARWEHPLDDGSKLQVQTYFDQTKRFSGNGGGGFVLDTYDIDIQHSFSLGSWNDIVWGGGDRINWDHTTNNFAFLILPDRRTQNLANVFVQDSISLSDAVKLTIGIKLEDDPYSGLAPLPNARVSWKLSDGVLLWSAVSRAVRAPTRFDRDVVEKLGGAPFLVGGRNFQSEKLTAYEVGTRIQPWTDLSFSISTFYNVYDDLRSVEITPVRILPLMWGNKMKGHVYGVEVWANYRVTDWWRLTAGFNVLRDHLSFVPGSSRLAGLQQAGDDPHHQVSLRSSMNITPEIAFDVELREVASLPNPRVPAYAELNARLGWNVLPSLELSITGSNLLHARHVEFSNPPITDEVERSFVADARWKF